MGLDPICKVWYLKTKKGWGSWSQWCSQCKTNGDNSSPHLLWDRHRADCKRCPTLVPSLPPIPGSLQCPKMVYTRMPEPGRTGVLRNHHYPFFLEVIPLSWVTKTLVMLSPTRPTVLTPLRSPLPTSDASGFCAPGSVLYSLPCQLSWNLSLQFNWLDPDGLYNQICAEVQATHPPRRLAGSYCTKKCALLNKCTFKNRPWCSGGKHLLYWAPYRVLESNMANGCITDSVGFPHGSVGKNPAARQEMQQIRLQALGGEDPLEEEMATHSSFLA